MTETFQHGFSTGPGAPWFHVQMGGYTTDDGDATPLAGGGLRVSAPAFRHSLPHESLGGVPATNDHAKWLAYLSRISPAGVPGFTPAPGAELAATARIGGRTFGVADHPFGAAVSDPDTDLRLSAFGMTSIDLETFMVFDVLFTNRRIYAFYERLPFGRTAATPYAAFSYAIPVRDRTPEDVHEASIVYDRAAGVVRWVLDGADVFRVTRTGHRLPDRSHLLIDLGGVEQDARPRQLTFGMGLFTLLDGALDGGPGLVRLSDALPYFAPRHGEPRPLSFVDESSRLASRLFGQGAEMVVEAYRVTGADAAGAPAPRAA